MTDLSDRWMQMLIFLAVFWLGAALLWIWAEWKHERRRARRERGDQ